jgi:hypothetical protein
MATTPNLSLTLLEASQSQKEVTVNEALFRIDTVLNNGIIDRDLNTPPVSPLEGATYIVAASPTGAWAGKANQIAYFQQIWRFILPKAGLAVWVIDEGKQYIFNGSDWSEIPSGHDNMTLNPSAAVYQRDIAATIDDAYFADGWYALTQTGTVLPARLSDPEDGFRDGVRLTQSQATAQRFGFAQILEGRNCKFLRGKPATLLPRIRISQSVAVRYALLAWTGTEDSVTSDVVNSWTSTDYSAGNFFLASNVVVLGVAASTPAANSWTTLPALTVNVPSSLQNIVMMVWTEAAASQNVTLDFDYIGFNAGNVAGPIKHRMISDELTRCRRYLPSYIATNASNELVAMGQCISTTAAGAIFPFLVPARIPPTGIIASSVSHFTVRDAVGAAVNLSAFTIGGCSMNAGAFNVTTSTASLVAGNITRLFTAANASAKFIFTGAEL